MDVDGHAVNVSFLPGDDLQGSLVAEFKQITVWADWPIYEINCGNPDDQEATTDESD
jgi:hypothetical protein